MFATGATLALVLGATAAPATARHSEELRTVAGGLDGPRGVATVGRGVTLVSEADGSVSVVVKRRGAAARVRELTSVPTLSAPAIAYRKGTVYILTGAAAGPPEEGAPPVPEEILDAANTLFKWRAGWAKPREVADIGAYQAKDVDPYNLEGEAGESNAFGMEALSRGRVLVADAANNDVLMVNHKGAIRTVARVKPRTVKVPDGFENPPPGTPVPAEAVTTSVTVGSDGAYYIGELRGFPATPGTSQIWRVKAGSKGAVCDPEKPRRGACTRYADGLTSIVDLAAGKGKRIYAVSLSKLSWLAVESPTPVPGASTGGLFQVRPGGRIRELADDKLTLPGGVDTGPYGRIFVTGPIFGPEGSGALAKVRVH